MRSTRRRAGMTLIEIVIVLVIIGILAAAGFPSLTGWRQNLLLKAAARDIADLFSVARVEAIRTGTTHCVFVWRDAENNVLTDQGGTRVAALLIQDNNGDGKPQNAEIRAFVPVDNTNTVSFGVTLASGSAPTDADPNTSYAGGWTFRDPNDATSSRVAFGPDGIPRGFLVTPAYNDGGNAGIGGGGGGIYLTNGRFDYAVVLAPLGGVRVHPFNPSANAWAN